MNAETVNPQFKDLRQTGPDSARQLSARNAVAADRLSRGMIDSARSRFTELLDDCVRILGIHHPDTLMVRGNLAVCHFMHNPCASTAGLLEYCMQERVSRFGPLHPSTLSAQLAVVDAWLGLGRLDAAFILCSDAVHKRSTTCGPLHPDTVLTRITLGRIHLAAGRTGDAARVLNTVALESEALTGPARIGHVLAVAHLAMCRARQNSRIGAGVSAQQALRECEHLLGPVHPVTIDLHRELTDLVR
jgi:hypothetical protein